MICNFLCYCIFPAWKRQIFVFCLLTLKKCFPSLFVSSLQGTLFLYWLLQIDGIWNLLTATWIFVSAITLSLTAIFSTYLTGTSAHTSFCLLINWILLLLPTISFPFFSLWFFFFPLLLIWFTAKWSLCFPSIKYSSSSKFFRYTIEQLINRLIIFWAYKTNSV